MTIEGNTIRANGEGAGIRLEGQAQCLNNRIYNADGHGILVLGTVGDTVVSNNYIESPGQGGNNTRGISGDAGGATIQGNTIVNAPGEGIFFTSNISGLHIIGNRVINPGAAAVKLDSQVSNSWVINNAIGTADIEDNGSGNVVRQNSGHRTEASGTATVADGSTSVTVSHGLDVTPSANDCSVTPTNNLGTASEFWADTFGASDFTINVDADPGADTATFAWTCQVL